MIFYFSFLKINVDKYTGSLSELSVGASGLRLSRVAILLTRWLQIVHILFYSASISANAPDHRHFLITVLLIRVGFTFRVSPRCQDHSFRLCFLDHTDLVAF